MKDVIDVKAREIRPKPKFLTGTPGWMEGPVGVVLGAVTLLFAILALIDWL